MLKDKRLILILILTMLILGSCKPKTQEATKTTDSASGYPIASIDSGYPVEEHTINEGYPITEEGITYTLGPEFNIYEPVREGDTVVSGTGPKGVPINLVDVSEVGAMLGTTIIKDDGTFQFDLSEGLQEKHQIGLQLGDLTGTGLREIDFVYSNTYFVRPMVGILFDMAIVQ